MWRLQVLSLVFGSYFLSFQKNFKKYIRFSRCHNTPFLICPIVSTFVKISIIFVLIKKNLLSRLHIQIYISIVLHSLKIVFNFCFFLFLFAFSIFGVSTRLPMAQWTMSVSCTNIQTNWAKYRRKCCGEWSI